MKMLRVNTVSSDSCSNRPTEVGHYRWRIQQMKVADRLYRIRYHTCRQLGVAALLFLLGFWIVELGNGSHKAVNLPPHTQDSIPDPVPHLTDSDSNFTPRLSGSLDSVLLLGNSKSLQTFIELGGRLLFIGDIHGCLEELLTLLAKLQYDPAQDHIITTGDMVNKGPHSAGVLDFLMEHQASCVMGNHDHKILQIVHELSTSGHPDNDESRDEMRATPEAIVARSLSAPGLDYLRACPAILQLGKIQENDVVVVHAGLVPSIPLEKQDALHVMNMRIIDVKTHIPSPAHNAKHALPWFQLWNTYQELSIMERRKFAIRDDDVDDKVMTVVYGHDAKKGLQVHRYTRGLDTKCVAGGKLTAMVVSKALGEEIVQVDCKKYRD